MGAMSLPDSGLVYLDANSIIYAVEKITPFDSILEPLWNAARSGQISLITSELTFLETLTKPLRENQIQLEKLFRDFLSAPEISMIPVTLSIWEKAAGLRGLGLKTPDAIHAATSIVMNCSLFVTNDASFQRVANLPIVILSSLASS